MRMSGVLFGVAVGATLMYLFDPRQGVERREVWGERLKKGREQAQSAVETGRIVTIYKTKAEREFGDPSRWRDYLAVAWPVPSRLTG